MPVHLSTPVPGGCVRGRVPFTHASSRCSLPLFLGVPELVGVQQGDGNICPGEALSAVCMAAVRLAGVCRLWWCVAVVMSWGTGGRGRQPGGTGMKHPGYGDRLPCAA